MGWASRHIERLKAGEAVEFRPHGHSMSGRVESGQLCRVEPVRDHGALAAGDIVLCTVRGAQYLHLVKARRGEQLQIGNNRGHVNGWVGPRSVHGLLTRVSD